jgi:hypothetical protein
MSTCKDCFAYNSPMKRCQRYPQFVERSKTDWCAEFRARVVRVRGFEVKRGR